MNIKLAQGKAHLRPKVVAQNEKNPSGAKAHVLFEAFMARLKSCPDTEPAMPIVFWRAAGTGLIFIQGKCSGFASRR